MKSEAKNLDTPKNLEQRITAVLTSAGITSGELAVLINETETAVSDATKKVELQRALDISVSPDPAAAHRMITENEFLRARLRLTLPELQQKLAAAREQEDMAQWAQEFLRIQTIRDKAAEKWARVPQLISELIELFRLAETIDKECSHVNGSAPAGEHRRLIGPELKARGLAAFSRANPPIAKGTTLPDWVQSEATLWPPKSSSFSFASAPQDIRHTSEWHRAATEQRRLNDERIDRELSEMEAAKQAFYRGH
jgi:hypothetical protein